MTDNAYLFHILEDGRWHSQDEIIRRSQEERGYGMTVHSRAADLRKKGCIVDNEQRRTGNGRTVSYYRMTVSMAVALNELAPTPAGEPSGLGWAEAHSASSLSVPATDGADNPTGESPPPSVGTAGTLLLFPEPVRGAYGDAA